MMDVWLIEVGEYADRFICGVVSSPDAAAELLKKTYGEPYLIRWEAPARIDDDEWSITGHFTGIPGYCGDGPHTYTLWRHTVDGFLMGSGDRSVPSRPLASL